MSVQVASRQVKLSTGALTYGEAGTSGPTLLMLHGIGFRHVLHPFMQALQPHFRLFAPDLPFSTQDGYPQPHTLDNYAGTLLELVDHLGLHKPTIFGNSVGGTLALMFALKAPHRVGKLVVRCPLWSPVQLPLALRLQPLVALHQALSRFPPYARWALDIFYSQSARLSPTSAGPQPPPQKPYQPGQVDPAVLSRFLGHLIRVEFRSRLPTISNPTLVLWGGSDRFISPRWGAWLSERLPDARFLPMAGEFHNIATVQPQKLVQAISTFLLND